MREGNMLRARAEESGLPDRYQELAHRLAETRQDGITPPNRVVAFVAAHPKAGVTHIIRNLASQMNAGTQGVDPGELTIAVDCDRLGRAGAPFGEMVAEKLAIRSMGPGVGQDPTLEVRLNQLSQGWKSDSSYRIGCVNALRGLFKFTLIDCRSLKSSWEVSPIATLVDGVIIVVDADRTTRSQVDYLTKVIKKGRGRVLGYILNRRTYPIPEGLYQTLERGGLT